MGSPRCPISHPPANPMDLCLTVLPPPPPGLLGGSRGHPSGSQVRGAAWVMQALRSHPRPGVQPCLWRGHEANDEDTEARELGQPGHPVGQDSKDTGLLSEHLGLRCPTHRRLRSSFISSFRILFSSLSPFISLAAKSGGN